MSTELKQNIFLLPANIQTCDASILKNHLSNFDVISLQHPRTRSKTACALNSNKLYEIVKFSNEFSSWFINDSVIEDGSLFMLTLVDPLFFLIPLFNKDGKFTPLEDIVIDEDYPDTHYLLSCCDVDDILNIADVKDTIGLKVYSYNKTKTLIWLKEKVKQLTAFLTTEKVSCADGSWDESLVVIKEQETNEILKNACHLVSEYLPTEISTQLFSSLEIQLKDDKISSDETISNERKKSKNITTEESHEDYSIKTAKNSCQNKKKGKLSLAQKQLLKADKSGMKTISSFFHKT